MRDSVSVCVGGGEGAAQTSVHLSPPGCVERVRPYGERRGEVDRHLICCYLLSRPGCCVVCLTLVKSSGLIKPTVRQARAHKRDDESRGMEWALMDISVELHWQGWRLEALHTQIGSLFEVESGSGQHSLYRLLH